MTFPYLPAELIVEMLRRLRRKARTEALTVLTNYMYHTQRSRTDCNPNPVYNPSHPEIVLHIQAISIIFSNI